MLCSVVEFLSRRELRCCGGDAEASTSPGGRFGPIVLRFGFGRAFPAKLALEACGPDPAFFVSRSDASARALLSAFLVAISLKFHVFSRALRSEEEILTLPQFLPRQYPKRYWQL
jgi:hypothetical protein